MFSGFYRDYIFSGVRLCRYYRGIAKQVEATTQGLGLRDITKNNGVQVKEQMDNEIETGII